MVRGWVTLALGYTLNPRSLNLNPNPDAGMQWCAFLLKVASGSPQKTCTPPGQQVPVHFV